VRDMTAKPQKVLKGDHVVVTHPAGFESTLVHLCEKSETHEECGDTACRIPVTCMNEALYPNDILTRLDVTCLWCLVGVTYGQL
jgi:hypothetical protein